MTEPAWNQSEYEEDCVSGAIPTGMQFSGIFGQKHIVILRQEEDALADSLYAVLLVLNTSQKLQARIEQEILSLPGMPQTGQTAHQTDQQTDIDLVFYTAVCNQQEIPAGEKEQWQKQLVEAQITWMKEASPKVWVTCSDYRIFAGDGRHGICRSENETGYAKAQQSAGKPVNLQYETESTTRDQAEAQGMNYLILRSGALIGPGIKACSPLHKAVLTAGLEQEIQLSALEEILSFVYVSDYIRGILTALHLEKWNQTYQIAGRDMNYSGYEAAGLIYRSLGRTLHIRQTKETDGVMAVRKTNTTEVNTIEADTAEQESPQDYSMNTDKLANAGFKNEIDMKSALLIMDQYSRRTESPAFSTLYDGKIRQIQQLVLTVLLEIDRICKTNGITYALGGGTLLGAVRHGGFIPWDEDADLIMSREDYERFVQIAPKELPDTMMLQTPENDPKNHFYTKIRVKDTILATKFTSGLEDFNQGIFVDIFVHDNTSNHRLMQKLHCSCTIVARSLVFNKWGNTAIAGKDGGHAVLRTVFTAVKNALPMSFLEKQQFRIIRWYAHSKNSRYVYDGMGQNIRNGVFPRAWIEENEAMEFEGHVFPVPKEYDRYLRYLYGEYTSRIPIRKRLDDSYARQVDLGPYDRIGSAGEREKVKGRS